MGSMSMGHWLVVLAVIILLFGAKKIPELAKGVGKGIKSFKAEMEEPVEKVESKEQEVAQTKVEDTTKNS